MLHLCVMGNPIEHSQSPWIHSQFAKQFNLSLRYIKIKPDVNSFIQAVHKFKDDGGLGLNVTIPFKEQAFEITEQASERASIAKAVNTILFNRDGAIVGDNTDGIGIVHDITQNLKFNLSQKTILILGAGGAVRGILHPILMQLPAKVIIVNRTLERAKQLAQEFAPYGNVIACTSAEIKQLLVDIVIDGTSFDAQINLLDSLTLSKHNLCYDLKYGKNATPFMKWAQSKKADRIVDGIGMLIEQAAEAFFIWTGYKPETKKITSTLRAQYQSDLNIVI